MTSGAPAASAYDAQHFAHNYPDNIEKHFWSLARNRLLLQTLNRAAAAGLRSPQGRILEVGCAIGVVVSGLRKSGCDIWGVDLGRPTPLPDVTDRVSAGVKAQDLDPAFRNSIETLMLLDVIEHIEDEVSFLKDLLPSFPNCRCVIVTVPARQEAWSKWDDYYGHHRRYTADTLADALKKSGLTPQRTRYFFRSLYVVAVLINWLGIERRTTVRPLTGRFALHRIVGALLSLENSMLGNLPLPGLSLVCTTSIDRPR